MAVCKVAITGGYTADAILYSSFCFTEIQFTLFLLMPHISILCYLFCFQLPMTLPSCAFCPKNPETKNSHFGVKLFNDRSSFCKQMSHTKLLSVSFLTTGNRRLDFYTVNFEHTHVKDVSAQMW